MIIGSFQVKRAAIKADTQVSYARATVTAVLEDNSGNTEFGGGQRVQADITSGEYKGTSCILDNSNSYQRGAYCLPGTKVIAMIQQGTDGTITGTVNNYDRTGLVYGLLALFIVILLVVGGRKGVASVLALGFTFVCLICLYIPLLYTGMNGVLAAVLSAVVILIISIYILNGWSIKTGCAILGTTAGIVISGGLAMLLGQIFHLSGYHMSDAESMVYIANNTSLQVSDILYAGIIISSLGAVMDVSVSVVAAMQELREKVPAIKAGELFKSGMHVGHDMMGTMSNTLILAYAGSATGTILTIYSYEMPYLQIMGYNSIIIELLCGLCGTIGVILTVPLQAGITSLLLTRAKHMV